MRWLLFLSRLAFICGFFFLVSLSLLYRDWANDIAIVSTIIIIGHVIGIIAVPLVNVCYLVLLLTKRQLLAPVPRWLMIANMLFLFILAAYIYLQYG